MSKHYTFTVELADEDEEVTVQVRDEGIENNLQVLVNDREVAQLHFDRDEEGKLRIGLGWDDPATG